MKRLIGIGTVISAMMLLSACVAAPAGLTAENTPPEPSVLLQTATEVPTLTPAAAQPPSETPIPPTATPKPTTVPPVNFVRPGLRTGIVDVNYVEDACQFYSQRWVEGNAAPWTVVLPVMFHGVRKEGGEVSDNMTVTHDYFVQSMEHAKKLGFDTITSKQLVDFLERNAPIPERSLLLIIDDRR
ncbi:MAG TPA: hypothetical protein PKD55_21890, partial [Bellilinea sp.]|nr:hypothetical protein [Bellilinea sp.]